MSKPKPAASSSAPPAPNVDHLQVISSLREQLSRRTDEVLESKGAVGLLERRIAELTLALQDSEAGARDIAAEAARRAKEREDSLQASVHALEAEAERLRAQLALATEAAIDTQRAHEAVVRAKNDEYAALRSRTDDLAAEFGDMLHTLTLKLQERARLVEPAAEGSGEGQSALLKAMKEAVPLG